MWGEIMRSSQMFLLKNNFFCEYLNRMWCEGWLDALMKIIS